MEVSETVVEKHVSLEQQQTYTSCQDVYTETQTPATLNYLKVSQN